MSTSKILEYLIVLSALMFLLPISKAKDLDWLDKLLLDPSLRRAGLRPDTPETQAVKKLGKDWLNPFASEEDIRRDIEIIRIQVESEMNSSKSQLKKLYMDDSISAETKRRTLIQHLGRSKYCPLCHQRWPLDFAYCPRDGTRTFLFDPRTTPLRVIMDEDFAAIPEGLIPDGWLCNQVTAVSNNSNSRKKYLQVRGDAVFIVPLPQSSLPLRIEIWLEAFLDSISCGDVSLIVKDHNPAHGLSLGGSDPIELGTTDIRNDCFYGRRTQTGRCRIIDIYPTHVKFSATGRSGKTYQLAIVRSTNEKLGNRLTIRLVSKYKDNRVYRLRLTQLGSGS